MIDQSQARCLHHLPLRYLLPGAGRHRKDRGGSGVLPEHGLDQFIHTVTHFIGIHGHVPIVLDDEGARIADTVLMVAIGIKLQEDRVSVTHILIQVHHALLLTHVVHVAELVHLHDDNVGAEINKNIGTVAGTSALDGLVPAEGNRILEMGAKRIYHVVLLEAEAAGDGVVGVEDAVTAEAVGLPAGLADVDVPTVLAGDFGVTVDAGIADFVVDTCELRIACNTLVLLSAMLT